MTMGCTCQKISCNFEVDNLFCNIEFSCCVIIVIFCLLNLLGNYCFQPVYLLIRKSGFLDLGCALEFIHLALACLGDIYTFTLASSLFSNIPAKCHHVQYCYPLFNRCIIVSLWASGWLHFNRTHRGLHWLWNPWILSR